MDGIIAAVRAAEKMNSPAMVEIFPWSIHFQGPQFVKYAADVVHAASVPMSLHLDHCTEEADVYMALELPFDSIMVDASSKDPEKNITFVKEIVRLAEKKGITIEAEMGRIQGGEDGIPTVDLEALYTEPEMVVEFVKRTGVHYVAPSFGNIHGIYPPGGPEKYWQMDRLTKIRSLNPSTILVLHGVYPVVDSLVKESVRIGIRKINLNGNLYEEYLKFISENCQKLGLATLQEKSIELIVDSAVESIKLLGSDGKATYKLA